MLNVICYTLWVVCSTLYCSCLLAIAAVTSQSDRSSHSDLTVQPKLPASEETAMPKVPGAETPMSFAGINRVRV